MKKLLVTLLIMTMSLSLLVGCGGNEDADSGNASDVNQEADQEADADQEDATDQEKTENDDTVADADNPYGYVAPTELGATLDTLTLKLEGEYYQFPMPLSAFLENGWMIPDIYTSDELLNPGEGKEMVLENADGQILYKLLIWNLTDEPQKQEDTLVIRMLVTADQELDFELPEGISFASTEDELKAVTAEGSIIQNGNYTTCTWDNETRTNSISAWYHPEIGIEYFEMMGWY